MVRSDPKPWRVVKTIEKTVAEHSVWFDMALLVTDILIADSLVKTETCKPRNLNAHSDFITTD